MVLSLGGAIVVRRRLVDRLLCAIAPAVENFPNHNAGPDHVPCQHPSGAISIALLQCGKQRAMLLHGFIPSLLR